LFFQKFEESVGLGVHHFHLHFVQHKVGSLQVNLSSQAPLRTFDIILGTSISFQFTGHSLSLRQYPFLISSTNFSACASVQSQFYVPVSSIIHLQVAPWVCPGGVTLIAVADFIRRTRFYDSDAQIWILG
jgi:hypothetical protein